MDLETGWMTEGFADGNQLGTLKFYHVIAKLVKNIWLLHKECGFPFVMVDRLDTTIITTEIVTACMIKSL